MGRGACIQSLLVSVLLLVLVFPCLSPREFSGLTPQQPPLPLCEKITAIYALRAALEEIAAWIIIAK